MDAEDFLKRAEEGKRKHAADLATRELQVQAANRRTHLKNALQSFGELWSSSFLDSLPSERAPSGEWSGQEWAQHRPEFDDWRTAKTMAICNDERLLAWRQEILALAPSDIPQRNTAVLILQAAIQGKRDTVRAIWGSMLPEAADDKELYPNSDPALLPSLVIMWLKWKLAEEMTEGEVSQPAAFSVTPPIQEEPTAQSKRKAKSGGRPPKWAKLDELILADPEASNEELARRHNAGNHLAIKRDKSLKADAAKVQERRYELGRKPNATDQE